MFLFTYEDTLENAYCIVRIYTPIEWKSNCNWSLGLASSNLELILTGETNAKESVHGTSKELFVESKHEAPPCLTMHKLLFFALPQILLFT